MTTPHSHSHSEGDAAALARLAADANDALINGDIEGWLARVDPADDFTLMSPFGGPPSRGFDGSSDRIESLRRMFSGGTTALEVVQGVACGELAVLVAIERQRAEVGGLPAQDWSLRVTLVFREEASRWRLLHRHADPLVQGIALDRVAALARGN